MERPMSEYAADAPRMDFDAALQLLWDSLRGAAA